MCKRIFSDTSVSDSQHRWRDSYVQQYSTQRRMPAPSAECQHTEAWPARTYLWIFSINMTVYCLDNHINLRSRTFNAFFFVLFSFKGQNLVLSSTPISPVCPFWILKCGLEQFCQNCLQILYKTKDLACLKLKLSEGNLNTNDNAITYGQVDTVFGAIRNDYYLFMNLWEKRKTLLSPFFIVKGSLRGPLIINYGVMWSVLKYRSGYLPIPKSADSVKCL